MNNERKKVIPLHRFFGAYPKLYVQAVRKTTILDCNNNQLLNATNMIRQCAILFGCLALGEWVVYLTGVKLPSSIIGMLLLTLFLKLKWIKLEWVQGMSDFLVANLGFFFVPPGVALMLYFDIIQAQFWPIVVASVISTFLVFAVTGWVHQLMRKMTSKNRHN